MTSSPTGGSSLRGQTALVSGGGSGIGAAAARRLAAAGAHIFVTDANAKAAAEAVESIVAAGGSASSRELDVTQESHWAAAMEEILAATQRLDILVASAGISRATPIANMTLAEWRAVMSINLDGVFLGVRAAIGAMRRGTGGSIVLVTSASGIRAAPGAAAYAASKAAVRHFAKCAALECGQDGIRVNCIAPGAVRTPMWEAMPFFQERIQALGSAEAAWHELGGGSPMRRVASPEEIAEGILYLASPRSGFVTGTELVMDGGYTA